MSHWYRELVTKLTESPMDNSFVLNPICNPDDYQITDSFKDITKWRAKNFYEGRDYNYDTQAVEEAPKGTWQRVVLVLISETDNSIIPVARSDEHHHGLSMFHDRYSKSRTKFVPINAQGNNYIYNKKDLAIYIPIFEKFISWGGNPNLLVIGSNEMSGTKITIGDLLSGQPFVKHDDPTKLAPVGQRIYDAFKAASDAMVKAIQSKKEVDFNIAKKMSRKILLQIKSHGDTGIGFPWQDYDKCMKAIEDATGIQSLLDVVFGFDGIKNKIHNELREYKDKTHWNDDKIATWGNLDLAIDMLGNL